MRSVVNGFSLDNYRWRRERATGLAVPSAGPAGKPAVSNGHHDGSFIIDSSLDLYLPLWQFDVPSAKTFKSVDQRQRLCTVTGALWTPQGRDFDYVDDFIQVGTDLFETDTSGTIIAWIKREVANAEHPIFSSSVDASNNLLQLVVPASNVLTLQDYYANAGPRNNAFSGNTTLSAGVWYMVALISSGTAWSMYVNTTLQTLTTIIGSNNGNWFGDLNAGTHNVRVARCTYAGGTTLFNGVIGEVWVYSRALSVAEIAHNYAATRWRYA